jgi:hypothetical protein
VWLAARLLQLTGHKRKSHTLINGFKAFCVQNDPRWVGGAAQPEDLSVCWCCSQALASVQVFCQISQADQPWYSTDK